MAGFGAILAAHRYKLGVVGLLAAASVVCIALVAARTLYSGSPGYAGLVWNLFLAWIPFVLAYLAYVLSWRRPLMYFVIAAFAGLWLIFFPNAPYIITDFKHLADPHIVVPAWYDVMVLMWFSWTGLLLGIVSLYLMHDIVHREFGRWVGWALVFAVSVLSGLGVYIGRFIRWNSWDLLTDPVRIAQEFMQGAQDPSLRSIGFTVTFAAFFLFIYLMLYSFGHLLQERGHVE